MKFSTHTFEDEIFSIGDWEGFKATPKVLRDIVNNFTTFSEIIKAPLKLGHNDEQEITDGQPALGWITSVRLDNETNPKKVFATYSNMPTIVFEAIKNKLYRTRSIEIETIKKDGKIFQHVLTAVALLGSDLPRVNNLRDLDKYLMSANKKGTDEDYAKYKIDSNRNTSISVKGHQHFSINAKIKEVSLMAPEEIAALQKRAADAELETAKLKAENTTLTSDKNVFSKQIEDRKLSDKVEAVKFKRKAVTELFETAVKAEVITPAQRESFSKLLGVDDDEKVIAIELENVKTLIGGETTLFSKKDTGAHESGNKDDKGTPSETLTAKTFEFMDKHGSEDFEKAMFSVMRTNPKLAHENMLSNGEKGAE